MSELPNRTEADDTELAEIVAEIGERMRNGEKIRPEDYENRADDLRDLLPAIRMMADLPGPERPRDHLGHLGDFLLVREVSRGGMGVVFEALQVSLGRRVALKVLPNAAALDPRHLKRFHVEAQAAASLDHPHIVPVFATGSVEGVPYYAMRFIDGRDLAQVIRDRHADEPSTTLADPLSPCDSTPLSTSAGSPARVVARLAKQAAEALDHAHANDVLHRDIKPSNLMIDETGALWITDFGLARVLGGLDLTHTGDAIGTPRYMSPEQALGRRTPIDGRTDIYSLGVTIYELLTLRPAFSGDDRIEILRQIAQDEPAPPRKIHPAIPVDLETIVLKAIAKSPADRYATAAEMAADLGRFLDRRPILARRPSLVDRGAKWMLRHRGLVASLAGALGLFAGFLAYAAARYTTLLRDHNAALKAEVLRANQHADESDRLRRLAYRHDYASVLRFAGQAFESKQYENAQDLLGSIPTSPEGDDPREFAWRYLSRASRREIVRLPARESETHEMALTRDGKTLLSKFRDGTITIWDLASERARSSFGPVDFVGAVFSPDGHSVLGARSLADGARWDVLLHDTATGTIIGRPISVAGSRAAAYVSYFFLQSDSALGCVFEAGSRRSSVSVRVWNVQLDAAMQMPVVALDGLRFAIEPRGGRFVTIEETGVFVRDASSGAIRLKLSPRGDATTRAVLSDDGRYLAVHFPERLIVVLDTSTGTERERHQLDGELRMIRFSRDASLLAAVDESGRVHILHRTTARPHALDMAPSEGLLTFVDVVFSPDGTKLASVFHSKLRGPQPPAVWDVASAKRIATFPGADFRTVVVIFTPDGQSLIIDGPRSPRIWHFEPVPEPPSPAGHKAEAWSAAFSHDAQILATGSDDTDEPETIKLWDPATGGLISAWRGGVGTVASLAFSPDGRLLASGHLTERDNVRLWDVATGKLLHTLRGHTSLVRSVAFSPDGRTLASAGGWNSQGGQERTIRLWDVASARCVRELAGHTDVVRSIAFSPDGRSLASASNDRTVKLWDTGSGCLLQSTEGRDKCVALAFSPDGATLAVATGAGMVTLHDAGTLAMIKTIRHENSEVLLNLAFAHDGRSLATCGLSGAIRIWDPLTGQELLALPAHKTQVNGIAFAPDGLSLASCSHDGEVKLWRARSLEPR